MLENPMYLADPPEPEHFTEADYSRTVDLKWSLWSRDKATWDEHSPGTWGWMREWFNASSDDGNPESPGLSDAPRIVETAPRKEIRFGKVAISPGSALVHFYAKWDNGREFHVGQEHAGELIEAETFEELMHLIDHREVDLMRAECAADHNKKGWRLRQLRCHECGYPYQNKTSRRLSK